MLDPLQTVTTKAPPPPPPPPPRVTERPPADTSPNCHPSYEGECLNPFASDYDYDCAGGSGNGPEYVYGTVSVVGPDECGLDAGDDGYGRPTLVEGLPNPMVAVSAGVRYTCALAGSGAVYCWGVNDEGELGDGTRISRPAPAPVKGLSSGAVAISAARTGNTRRYTCALLRSGGIRCWGSIWSLKRKSLVPVAVAGIPPAVVALSSGSKSTCILTKAGAVSCWSLVARSAGGPDQLSSTPLPIRGLSTGVAAISGGDLYMRCHPSWGSEMLGPQSRRRKWTRTPLSHDHPRPLRGRHVS